MARKYILISDLSGQEVDDEAQAEIRVLSYPSLSQPVKLDASKAELDRLKLEAKPMALLELVTDDGVEQIAVDAGIFARAIKGDADEVMSQAEGLQIAPTPPPESPRTRRPRGTGAAASEKINYASMEHAGKPHKGRVKEAEAELVRNHLDAINDRLAQEGMPTIDPNDEKARRRYGFMAGVGQAAE